ncbi:unnamed protein product [Pedinophyceae sp. YPF-701]|nr:unnamed protein product [Pedinophyceae sp. YPF-701]
MEAQTLGDYVGDVKALCVCAVGHGGRQWRVLAAGIGSHVRLYDLDSGDLLVALRALPAARHVHGIAQLAPPAGAPPADTPTIDLLVCGDRCVSVTRATPAASPEQSPRDAPALPAWAAKELVGLPRRPTWVLDARPGAERGGCRSAWVGLIDNSVELWTLGGGGGGAPRLERRVACAFSALLYSMALAPGRSGDVRVAAGTIMNDIVVWEAGCSEGGGSRRTARSRRRGSPLCCTWPGVAGAASRTARKVLRGHKARLWDAAFLSDDVVATASEDRTVRLWRIDGEGEDGREVERIHAHSGRGVWTCAYAGGGVLVTGGADSGILTWHTRPESAREADAASECVMIEMPAATRGTNPGAGKANKTTPARAVALASPKVAYVATSVGSLWMVALSAADAAAEGTWKALASAAGGRPLTSVAALHLQAGELVAAGDAFGGLYVAHVRDEHWRAEGEVGWAWQMRAADRDDASRATQLQFPPSLAGRCLLSMHVSGELRIWGLGSASDAGAELVPLAVVLCSGTARYVSADVCVDRRLLALGDTQGNVRVCMLPDATAAAMRDGAVTGCGGGGALPPPPSLPASARATVAHARGAVLTVAVQRDRIYSAGRDGLLHEHMPTRSNDGTTSLETAASHRIGPLTAVYACAGDPLRSVAGFAGEQLVVWDLLHRRQAVRIFGGSHARPHALLLEPDQHATLVASEGGGMLSVRRAGGASSVTTAGLALQPTFHGKEVNSALALPSPGPAGSFVAVTVGEEGAVRCTPCRARVEGPARWPACGCGCGEERERGFAAGVEVAKLGAGASARALACVRAGGGTRWTVVAGGGKGVLAALELDVRCAAEGVRHRVLATRDPPKLGARPKWERMASGVAAHEHRYIAAAVFQCDRRATVAVMACSDTSLTAFVVDEARRTFVEVASLHHHASPVLALAQMKVAGRQLVVSGDTAGAVAVWDLTDAVSAGAPRDDAPAAVRPACVCAGVHQSGVNAIAACGGASAATIVTGGDDQDLALTALVVGEDGRCEGVRAAGRATLAHSSALRGVWTDGRHVASVGLDQALRFWRVVGGAGPPGDARGGDWGLEELSAGMVDVPEPSCLAVAEGCGALTDDEVVGVVCGRGAQVVTLRPRVQNNT